MRWSEGSFALSAEPVPDDSELDLSVTHALLAHAKQRDDQNFA